MCAKTIPARKDVPAKDKWDLSSIYKSDDEWEAALKSLPEITKTVSAYKGRLGESSITLLSALKELEKANLTMETVYHYASLQHEADEDDSTATDRYGRAMMAYTQMEAELSFFESELQEIADDKIKNWITLPEFADYRIYIEKLMHFNA